MCRMCGTLSPSRAARVVPGSAAQIVTDGTAVCDIANYQRITTGTGFITCHPFPEGPADGGHQPDPLLWLLVGLFKLS